MLAKKPATVVPTRWALVSEASSACNCGSTVLADVLECCGEMESNSMYLKVNVEFVKLSLEKEWCKG